jgi:thiosulfate dehydrogenase
VRGFFLGVVVTLALLVGGAYLCVRAGFYSMAVSAPKLPMEGNFAEMMIEASIGSTEKIKNPLPYNDESMVAGAKVYKGSCGGCHGVPGKDNSMWAKAMYPSPPQFFTPEDQVTGEPEGDLYWIASHGIRFTGMPSFNKFLTETERWQVTMLLKHSDALPAAAQAVFQSPPVAAAE